MGPDPARGGRIRCETGRAETRYYLLNPKQYLVQHQEVRYAEPISVQNHPVILSRITDVFFSCDGKFVDPLSPADKQAMQADVDSTLAWAQRAGH